MYGCGVLVIRYCADGDRIEVDRCAAQYFSSQYESMPCTYSYRVRRYITYNGLIQLMCNFLQTFVLLSIYDTPYQFGSCDGSSTFQRLTKVLTMMIGTTQFIRRTWYDSYWQIPRERRLYSAI